MNRRELIGGLVVATVAAPVVVAADEISTWVAWWERSKTYTMAIAEAMPANDYNFAPFGAGTDGVRSGDGARTFAQVMQHIAQAEGFYLGRLNKGAAPAAPQNDTSRATTLKYLGDTLDWSIGVVRRLTPADLGNTFAGGPGPAMTGVDLLLNAMIHTAHTRGYADMYLRNKGVKPPTYKV
jgi:uncharacterized damage-inducible protein DinB